MHAFFIETYVGSDADSEPVCRGKEGAEPRGKTLYLLLYLHSYPHLWSGAVGSD